jgi:hypothetical protein
MNNAEIQGYKADYLDALRRFGPLDIITATALRMWIEARG